MRFIIITILAASSYWGCASPESPYFEGVVSYTYSYQSDALDADSLRTVYPKTSDFYYSGPNYKSVFQAQELEEYIYFGENGKCYTRDTTGSGFLCEDYSKPTDTVFQLELRESDEVIPGHACQLLAVKAGGFDSEFYFSPEIRLPPESYRLHEAYNWRAIMEKTGGGMILKSVHHFEDFTMTGVATALRKEAMPDTIFEVPPAAIASPCD
jgi:hypothetical protein